MVEGLVCADTSMDLHLTNDGAGVERATEFKFDATDMFLGLLCGDSSMDLHLGKGDSLSPYTPSQGLPTEV